MNDYQIGQEFKRMIQDEIRETRDPVLKMEVDTLKETVRMLVEENIKIRQELETFKLIAQGLPEDTHDVIDILFMDTKEDVTTESLFAGLIEDEGIDVDDFFEDL